MEAETRGSIYFSWAVSMAALMPMPESARAAFAAKALAALACAVDREELGRGSCRDTDRRAAMRVRPWAVG